MVHGRGIALAFASIALLATAPAGVAFTAHRVPADLTDPEITGDRAGQPNRVWAPAAASRRGVLLVRFPGSDGSTGASDLMAERLATDGFHVISLAYDPGGVSLRATCTYARVEADPDCALKFRGERFYGGGYDSPFIGVDRAHSVMNRLIKLLGHLERTHADEGWGRFVSRRPSAVYDGAKPRFDRIMVSGHSQGAGMALFTARERRVLAVGMFGGANDYAVRARRRRRRGGLDPGSARHALAGDLGSASTLENGHAGQLAVWARSAWPAGPPRWTRARRRSAARTGS